MVILLILIALFTILIGYYYHHSNYWSRRGIPGPTARLFFGNFYDLANKHDPLILVLHRWTKEYGKVYGVQSGIRKQLVISDPKMLQELFVTKFEYFYGRKSHPLAGNVDQEKRVHVFEARGARWKRLRTLAAPSFSSGSLKKLRHPVEQSALELVDLLSKHAEGEAVNVHDYYQEYTMDVISKIAMGEKESHFFNNPQVKRIQAIFGRDFSIPIFAIACAAPILGPVCRKIFFQLLGKIFSFQTPIMDPIYKAVDERIARREADASNGIPPGEPEDFIDLFLDAKVDENSNNSVRSDTPGEFNRSQVKIDKVLTREEIVAQCFVFLLAGFDTTANSLSYTSYLLANNPDKLEKVLKEIDEVCTDDDTISYEQLSNLKYLENCMKETLRLYPLGGFASSRRCMKETTLGNVKIEEGIDVMADVWTLQRDREYWGEDAEEFVPERWERDKERIQKNLIWMPFGAGPRVCIGQRLAYMEEKLALAHLFKRFTVRVGPKTEKELTLVGSATVSPLSVNLYIDTRN